MAFPIAPINGDVYKVGNSSYTFNGVAWDSTVSNTMSNSTSVGDISVPAETNSMLIGPVGFDSITVDTNSTLKII